jgi:hypothetical protein
MVEIEHKIELDEAAIYVYTILIIASFCGTFLTVRHYY